MMFAVIDPSRGNMVLNRAKSLKSVAAFVAKMERRLKYQGDSLPPVRIVSYEKPRFFELLTDAQVSEYVSEFKRAADDLAGARRP